MFAVSAHISPFRCIEQVCVLFSVELRKRNANITRLFLARYARADQESATMTTN